MFRTELDKLGHRAHLSRIKRFIAHSCLIGANEAVNFRSRLLWRSKLISQRHCSIKDRHFVNLFEDFSSFLLKEGSLFKNFIALVIP